MSRPLSIRNALLIVQHQREWNQSQMAKALGITRGRYGEILMGKRMLSYNAACRAYQLGVSVESLLYLGNRRLRRQFA